VLSLFLQSLPLSLTAILNGFIQDNPPFDRVVAVPAEPHFIFDCYFKLICARPMPAYSVPGSMDGVCIYIIMWSSVLHSMLNAKRFEIVYFLHHLYIMYSNIKTSPVTLRNYQPVAWVLYQRVIDQSKADIFTTSRSHFRE
jgi:hypothetical protein